MNKFAYVLFPIALIFLVSCGSSGSSGSATNSETATPSETTTQPDPWIGSWSLKSLNGNSLPLDLGGGTLDSVTLTINPSTSSLASASSYTASQTVTTSLDNVGTYTCTEGQTLSIKGDLLTTVITSTGCGGKIGETSEEIFNFSDNNNTLSLTSKADGEVSIFKRM